MNKNVSLAISELYCSNRIRVSYSIWTVNNAQSDQNVVNSAFNIELTETNTGTTLENIFRR